jgi:hypothetical protein
MKNNKKFIQDILAANFIIFLGKIIFAGLGQAFVAFFTKKGLENWYSKKE